MLGWLRGLRAVFDGRARHALSSAGSAVIIYPPDRLCRCGHTYRNHPSGERCEAWGPRAEPCDRCSAFVPFSFDLWDAVFAEQSCSLRPPAGQQPHLPTHPVRTHTRSILDEP